MRNTTAAGVSAGTAHATTAKKASKRLEGGYISKGITLGRNLYKHLGDDSDHFAIDWGILVPAPSTRERLEGHADVHADLVLSVFISFKPSVESTPTNRGKG